MMIIGQLLASVWFSLGRRIHIPEGHEIITKENGEEVRREIFLDGWVTEKLVKKDKAYDPNITDRTKWPQIDHETEYILGLRFPSNTELTKGTYPVCIGSLLRCLLWDMVISSAQQQANTYTTWR